MSPFQTLFRLPRGFMQLLLIIAVLAAVAAAQAEARAPVDDAGPRVALTLVGIALVGVVASLIARRFCRLWRQERLERAEWLRRLDLAQRWHAALWLAVVLATMFALDWPTVVRANFGLARWVLIDDLLLLLPVVTPLLLSWGAFHQIEAALAGDVLPGRADGAEASSSRWRYAFWQARQHLAILLAPLLLLMAAEDLLRLTAPTLLEDQWAGLWAIPAILLLLAAFPLLLRRLWRTTPLEPGSLANRLQATLRNQGARVRGICVWHTDGRMVNAAVAGCIPRWRYIFLTDRLLARFSEEQVAAVVAHELGHVRGSHLPLRVLVMILPALYLLALGRWWPGELAGPVQPAALASVFSQALHPAALLFPLILIAYAATVLGRYSRLLELEADFLACCPVEASPMTDRVGRMSLAATEDFLSTLARLAETGDLPADRATWLHPSLISRARVLLTLVADARAQERFSHQLRRVRWLIFAASGLGLLLNVLPL